MVSPVMEPGGALKWLLAGSSGQPLTRFVQTAQ